MRKKIHFIKQKIIQIKKIYFNENNSFRLKRKKLFSRSIAFLLR